MCFVCAHAGQVYSDNMGGGGMCLSAGGEFRSFSFMPSVSSELCRDGDN